MKCEKKKSNTTNASFYVYILFCIKENTDSHINNNNNF